jgi:signal transduction histidine kinase
VEPLFAKIELTALLDPVVRSVHPLMAERKLLFTIDLPSHPVRIEADVLGIQDALRALLIKAMDSASAGGGVDIAAENSGATVTITVRNTAGHQSTLSLPTVEIA